MVKTTHPSKPSGGHTIGRNGFSKISAVEGIRTSPRMDADFREFDRKGLSAEERRRELTGKYGHKK